MHMDFEPRFVKVMHEERVAELSRDFQAARRDAAFIRQQAERVNKWISRHLNNITSGMNQGGRGTLQPSA